MLCSLTAQFGIFYVLCLIHVMYMKVMWNGGTKYQASGPWDDICVVDIQEKSCSCRKWELTGMPCKHAVAVLNDMALNRVEVGLPETWVHACYWLVTWEKQYSYTINPCNGPNMWTKHPSPYTIIPPKIKPQIGRPPKKRRRSAEEISTKKMTANGKLSRAGKTVTCLKCKQTGHNKRTCKQPSASVGGSQSSTFGGSRKASQSASVGGSHSSKVGGSKGASQSASAKGKKVHK